jgi:carbon-monoxide dehydrogenase large subunit
MQVIAEHLGCELDDITFFQGDTMLTPYGAGTQGSRSAVLYGNALRQAAMELRDKVVTIAAHLLEASEQDLEIESGAIAVKGTPSKSIRLAQIGETA